MAEKKVIEIEIKDNSKSLKAQYKEAVLEVQKLADAFGETSVEVANAAKKAAELKDKIEDVNDAIQAQKGEGAFIALGKSVSAVANGFSAVQGAMGLVGVESEEVQQAMLRVQSAMALAQGLEGLEDAGRAFKQLGAVVKSTTIFTSAYNFVMGISNKETLANVAITEADSVAKTGLSASTVGLTTVTGGATTAMKLFRFALIATGIGAIIVLVGLLIANFDKVTKVVTTLSGYVIKAYDYFDNLGTGIKVLIGIFFPFIGVVYGAIKALEYFNVIDTKNERNMQARHEANMKRVDKSLAKQEQQRKARKKAYDEETGSIDRQIKLLEAQGKSTEALEKLQLKRSLTNQRELIKEARLNLQILRATNIGGVNDEMIEETLTAIAEMKQGILNTENEIKVARINNAKETKKEIDKIEKTDSIDLTKDPKYIAEQQRLAELNKLELDAIEKSEKAIKDANALKLQQEQEFQSQIEEIDEDNFQKGLQKTMTEEEYQLELVRQKYFTLEELAKGNAEQLAIIETAKALEIGAITKTASEKELADARAVAEQKSAIQQQGLDTAMQGVALIKGVFEKSKGVQKAAVIAESAIGIAKMIISNKLANVAALATPQAIATSGVAAAPVIAMNNVSTGLGIAANIAATTKALKTLGGGSAPDGGGGLGGSGGGAGGVVAPNLNVVGDTGINQLATLQQQPVKAYVVSNDVTSAQQFDMKVQQTAQI
jgi:enamine deaminase RidA (YjgF/YER057c/UK114 family)